MLVMTVLAVMWIPIMQAAQGAQIYRYSTTIKGYLGAPTSIMFLLAILWTRTTEQVQGLIYCLIDLLIRGLILSNSNTRSNPVQGGCWVGTKAQLYGTQIKIFQSTLYTEYKILYLQWRNQRGRRSPPPILDRLIFKIW